MKVGDLVRVRQDIEEFVALRGSAVGVIVSGPTYNGTIENSGSIVGLYEVHWSDDFELEKLYEDEVEFLSEGR